MKNRTKMAHHAPMIGQPSYPHKPAHTAEERNVVEAINKLHCHHFFPSKRFSISPWTTNQESSLHATYENLVSQCQTNSHRHCGLGTSDLCEEYRRTKKRALHKNSLTCPITWHHCYRVAPWRYNSDSRSRTCRTLNDEGHVLSLLLLSPSSWSHESQHHRKH